MALAHGDPAHLLPPTYKRMVAQWLEEDCPNFDHGGFVVGEEVMDAKLLGKSAVSFFLFWGRGAFGGDGKADINSWMGEGGMSIGLLDWEGELLLFCFAT